MLIIRDFSYPLVNASIDSRELFMMHPCPLCLAGILLLKGLKSA